MTSLAPLLIEGIQYSPLFSRCSGQTPASSSADSGTEKKNWIFLTPKMSSRIQGQPGYSLCSSAGQRPCSLCVQRPLFAGKLAQGPNIK